MPDEPKLLWTFEPDHDTAFEGAPVIQDGVVYLADAEANANSRVYALSLADGSLRWSAAFADTFFLAAPAVSGERIYVGDADGLVRALSVTDGAELWRFDTEGEVYAAPIVHGAGGASTVLVTTEIGRLHAIDAATGEERWRFEIRDPLRCSPTVVNGHALLAGCDGRLHAVSLADGAESGSCDIGGPTGCTAAAIGDVAYFGTESGEIYAIDVSDPAKPGVRWNYRDPRRRQGIRAAASANSSAIVYGSQGKGLYCLDPTIGEPVWTQSVKSKLEAGPLITGERVLVATSRGRLKLHDLATGDELWTFDAGGGFLADPAASDGRVVLASTDGVVYCFGE